MELYTLAIVLHVIGAVIGVGTVTIYDLEFFRAIGDRELAVAYQKSFAFYEKLIRIGLALLVLSGLYFMYARPTLWSSEKILAKLSLVAVLIINGFIINYFLHSRISKLKADDWFKKSSDFKKLTISKLPFDAISVASWYTILFLGAVNRQPWSFAQIAIGYILFLTAVYLIIAFAIKKRLI